MSDILNRVKAAHKPPSEQLQEAQAVLQGNASFDEKLKRLQQLERAAPSHEQPMFADLYASLQLSRSDDGR